MVEATGVAGTMCDRFTNPKPGGGFILTARFTGLKPDDVVSWQMLTPARVKGVARNVLTFAQRNVEGDEVELTLTASDRRVLWEMRDVSAAQGPDESPNPGLTMVSFALLADDRGAVGFNVRFEVVGFNIRFE